MPVPLHAKFLRTWERPINAYYMNYWEECGWGGRGKLLQFSRKINEPFLNVIAGSLQLKTQF
jgi:hypothetical protein